MSASFAVIVALRNRKPMFPRCVRAYSTERDKAVGLARTWVITPGVGLPGLVGDRPRGRDHGSDVARADPGHLHGAVGQCADLGDAAQTLVDVAHPREHRPSDRL